MALFERDQTKAQIAPQAYAMLGAATLVCSLAAWQIWQPNRVAPAVQARNAMQAEVSAPILHRAAAEVEVQAASMIPSLDVVVGKRDTLERIFRRLSLDLADLASIRNLPGVRQSLDALRPGDAIHVAAADGGLHALSRQVSETRRLEVTRDATGFNAKFIDIPVQTHVRTVTATIDTSLFQASDKAGISDSTALALANIFGWDIDFVLDLREGDRFTLVYEQILRNGDYLRDGEILAAEFVNAGKSYRAVRFRADGNHTAYYTPAGLPMRKAFLRAPVEFTRVSSRFNPHRRHPILNMIRGHMGTDYAAPAGTPVLAASDGRISFEGRKGGYGNALMIAHAHQVSTLYGHLSRFAPSVRYGSSVRQGQIIGFVGMSGLATGPHLHYEFLSHGVHKDPEKVQLPVALPLDVQALAEFSAQAAPLLARLDDPARSADARDRLRLAAH